VAAPLITKGIQKLFPKGEEHGPEPGPAPMANAPGGLGQTVTPPAPAQANTAAAAQAMPQQPAPLSREGLLQQLNQQHALASPEFQQYALEQHDKGNPKQFEELFQDFVKKKAKDRNQETQMPIGEQAEAPKKIEKTSFVSTPSGVTGIVESIKDQHALIKDDEGKLHKVASNDLIQSPIPEKDLADLHDELVKGIEKDTGQEVSRNVFWSGYDPQRNSLSYIPHGGGLYIYDDISPDDAKQLTSLLQRRKTSGENYIGAWTEGTSSPIGAAMSALIRKLQGERGGKGNEYSQKFDPIYSAFEPAMKAAKKKKKEKDKHGKK